MNLTDYTASELEIADRDSAVVLVPLGSVEQHGPHLPLGTKCFLAETAAYEANKLLSAEGITCVISPTLPFAPCHSSAGFNGVFSVSARTYSDALYEVGASFANEGFKNVYFVNFSLSPDTLKAVGVATADLNKIKGFKAYDPMPIWNYSHNEAIEDYLKARGVEPVNEIHADIKETSALLYLAPSLVKADILPSLKPCVINSAWEILKGNFSFKEMGSTGGFLGSPSLASHELGQLYVNEASKALFQAVKFTLRGNELPELPLQIRMLLKMADLDEM